MEAIASLSNEQLRKGVDKCKERIFSGDAWAPDLAEFLAMIYGNTQADFDAAFARCLARNPEGRIEKYVSGRVYCNVRCSSDTDARRIHRNEMKNAIELDKKGELTLPDDELKALPINSVKNENDLARERYEASGKRNPIQDRIDAIRKSK